MGDISASMVPNPSFEEHTQCPTSPDQGPVAQDGPLRMADRAVGWMAASSATPDYWVNEPSCPNPGLNTILGNGGGWGFRIDSSGWGIKATDGDAVIGTIGGTPDWNMEYFGTCLLSPLQSGVSYTLTMDVNAADDLKAWNDQSSGGDTNGDTVLLCVESCSSLPVPPPGNSGYLGEDGYAEYAKKRGWPALPGLPLQQGFPKLATASPGGGLEAGCGREYKCTNCHLKDAPSVTNEPENLAHPGTGGRL